MALPAAHEETEPAFAHTPEAELPLIKDDGVRVRLVAGSAWGRTSPVQVFSDMLYADVALAAGGKLPVDAAHEERALYTVSGEVEIAGVRFPAGQLLVLHPGDSVTVGNSGPERARFVLVGGGTMDGPRHIWWNFVSSRKVRIEQAKAEWKAGRFDTVPGDAEEFRCRRRRSFRCPNEKELLAAPCTIGGHPAACYPYAGGVTASSWPSRIAHLVAIVGPSKSLD